MKRINKKTKTEAITQILILVIATFAIAWIIGSEVGEVSASAGDCPNQCIAGVLYQGKNTTSGCQVSTVSIPCKPYGCTDGTTTCKTNAGSTTTTSGESTQKKDSISIIPTATEAITVKNEVDKLLEAQKAKKAALATTGAGTIGNAANAAANKAYNDAITAGLGKDKALELAQQAAKAAEEGTKTATKVGSFLLGGAHGVGQEGALGLGGVGAIIAWSAVAFLVGRYILGPKLGLTTQQSQSLGYALAGGTIFGLVTAELIAGIATTLNTILISTGVGAVIAFGLFTLLAKKTSVDIIQYGCSQWDSQSGKGLTESQMKQRCRLCDSQKDFVCTDYQCRSLGQGCMLINEEVSGKQLCIWNNTNDILAPIITPWKEALLEDFTYAPDSAISPPDKGVKITYTGTKEVTKDGTTRCAPPFTLVSFGVQLDEPAKCKISPLRLTNYSIMADVFMGDGIREYNHSFALRMPSQGALEAENFTVDNGGKYEFFVRCQDSNGNSNVANFVFKFCISQGPDTTPPKIEGTSLIDNQPLSYGQKFTNIELYVNEPAECKWSHTDQSYETMEQNLTCAKNVSEMNAQMLYTCRGNLTGIKDSQENKFYFRCKDQPYLNAARQNERNVNMQSYPLTLIGTEPLAIVNLGPRGIIEGPTEIVNVNLTAETERGYDEGKAICSFSETGTSGSYVDFFYGYDAEPFSQNMHSQELGLAAGDYTFFIQCRDKGGNRDEANVSFSVQVDTSPPIVVRVYKEDEYLKIITDESGRCVYSNSGCDYSFDEGTEMTSLDEKEHYVEWDISKDFYIKCEDEYQKSPLPNQCSIIVRPFEIFELQ